MQVRARLGIDELLRLEYARAQDILLLASICSWNNKAITSYVEDTTARLKFREEWRIEREERVLSEDVNCNEQLDSGVAKHVQNKGLKISKKNAHLQEYLCLEKWGNGEPFDVDTLKHLIKHSREYFEDLLRYIIDPTSQSPPSCKRIPGNLIRTRCKNRALDAKREYAVRIIQRIWRGFRSRKFAFENKNANSIIKCFRKHKQRSLILCKIKVNMAAFRIKNWLLRWTYVAKINRIYRQMLTKDTKEYISNLQQFVTEYKKERMLIVESQDRGLLTNWDASVVVQSFYRMVRGRFESKKLKNAIQIIYYKLWQAFKQKKVKFVKSWEDSMKDLAAQQKKWKRIRSCYKPHSNEILQVLIWRANSLAEVLDIEQSKQLNELECDEKFSEYEVNLERAVMNSKLDKDWLKHTVTDEGKQQYLNIKTGRVENVNPNAKKLEQIKRKQKQRAMQILDQHRLESDRIIDTITQNERSFRASNLERLLETIRAYDSK